MQRFAVNHCSSGRLRIIVFFVCLSYFLVLLQLFNTQILRHSYWSAQAKSQQLGTSMIPAERGELYTSDGFPIVLNSYKFNLIIDPSNSPSNFSDLEDMFKLVYKSEFDKSVSERDITLLKNKENIWKEIITNKDSMYGVLEKDVSLELKNALEDLNRDYISFEPIPTREYPDNNSFSHITGFVGADTTGKLVGYYGIEGFYNGDLKGFEGYSTQEVSAGGSPVLLGQFDRVDPINGSSLKLTIDRTIQTYAFTEIKKAVEEFGAESGTVIIIDPHTGKVLSMVNYPTYDPSKYYEYLDEDKEYFTNNSISSLYEPGSVIKALTMASAIDLGIVTPETTMVDSGPVYYSGHKVDNWDGKHHGEISMTQILQLSDNIGASWVGTKVGRKSLYNYFDKFNLNTKLGVDLEGEESGSLRDYTTWQDIDLAAASFGQGISTTPLQVVSAFSAIANDGVIMKPYIVDRIIQDDKEVTNKPVALRSVISPESSRIMVKMLTDAVSGGEAKYFVSKKYYVAGKTGTAQIAENGEYLPDKTNATFVGFLPNYKDFVMLVKLEKPSSSIYASETAVPVWMNLAEKLANYMGLPPDKYE